ncbi:MAG TPA: hypothetical protein VG013_22770 [Gemmataceae bacterium]|nr:hypothetical protein [Gemmataceae bacterium]
MSIFTLHSRVLADYRDFVTSFFTVADAQAREFVERALVDEARLWPDFLLQVSPSYARKATVDELAERGELHRETARIFRGAEDEPFRLYQHQVEALEKARRAESYQGTPLDVEGQEIGVVLMQLAVCTATACPLLDEGPGSGIHQSPWEWASSWRALDLRMATNVPKVR